MLYVYRVVALHVYPHTYITKTQFTLKKARALMCTTYCFSSSPPLNICGDDFFLWKNVFVVCGHKTKSRRVANLRLYKTRKWNFQSGLIQYSVQLYLRWCDDYKIVKLCEVKDKIITRTKDVKEMYVDIKVV